ncbi:MAG: RHS repeat domain-containing protein [Fimbriimonadaceae bacterium]
MNSLIARLVLLTGAFSVAASSSASGVAGMIALVAAEAQRRELQLANPYGEKPGPVKTDPLGRRDETRSKWLGPRGEKAVLEARMARMRDGATLQANSSPAPLALPPGGSGGGTNWEGAYAPSSPGGSGGGQGGGPGYGQGSGGFSNTATGNKQTVVPIVGWGAKGAVSVGLSLVHNSLDNYDFSFLGNGWTHTYDLWVDVDSGPNSVDAVVHYPDGMFLHYTRPPTGAWSPPEGYFDKLTTDSTCDTAVLVTADQTRYEFTRLDGSEVLYLTAVKDRADNTVTVNRAVNDPVVLTSVVDPSGRTLTFNYTGDRLTGVSGPGGRSWTFTQSSGRLTQIDWPIPVGSPYTTKFTYTATLDNIATVEDRRGNIWTYTYDATNGDKIYKETSPEGRTVRYEYNTSYTDVFFENTGTPELKLRHNYDANSMLLSEVDEAGFSVSYHYNAHNLVDRFTDERGYVWEATYDGNGNTTSLKDPLAKTWTWEYDSLNQPLWSKTPRQAANNVQTTYHYYDTTTAGPNKPLGWLSKVTDATGRELVQEVLYDQYGQVWKVKDGLGRVSEYTFDGNGDLTLAKRPDGTQTLAVYDDYGNPTSVTGPDSQTTTLHYDGMGRFFKSVSPGSAATEVGLDGEGNVTWAKDALGKQWDLAYDLDGLLVSRLSPRLDPLTLQRYEESYDYDARGLLTQVTDANGHVREYVRAPRGELWKVKLPDEPDAPEVWQHFATGQVSRHSVPRNRLNGVPQYDRATYSLDPAGRCTLADYLNEADVAVSYDDDGRVVSVTDGSGTTAMAHDLAGRLASRTANGADTTLAYDPAGAPTTMVDSLRGTFVTEYDSFGRVAKVRDPELHETTYSYDTAGRVFRATLGDGSATEFGYDANGRTDGFVLKSASGTVLRSESLVFDAVASVVSRNVDGITTTYAYDEDRQLVSESRPGYAAAYTYDGDGNRLSRTLNGQVETYSYDAGDKLLSIVSGGTVRTFSYDLAGRTISESVNGQVSRQFSWSMHGKLLSMVAGGSYGYGYNAWGAMVSRAGTPVRRSGSLPGSALLSEGDTAYSPGSAAFAGGTKSFVHGGPVSHEAQTVAGTLVATKSFDAFGNPQGSSGTWTGTTGFASRFGSTDEASGLVRVGERAYDPTIGRFLTRDPAFSGRNWYTYCRNNPTSRVDPSGLNDFLLPKNPGGLPPGWWQSGHGGKNRVDGGRGRYFPPWVRPGNTGDRGHSGPGLEWDPGTDGTEGHWHEVDEKGRKVKKPGKEGHLEPGTPSPVPNAPPNVEKEIGDIDGIVPAPAIIDPDTAATIGLAVVGAVAIIVTVILLPEIAIGAGAAAAVAVISGRLRPRRVIYGA